MRRPLNIKGRVPGSPEAVANMSVTLACEPPNNNLHYFVGRAVVQVGVQGSGARRSHFFGQYLPSAGQMWIMSDLCWQGPAQ